ncbi:MAG: toprim domain-containing protein [Pseudomonadota bacterium]
MNASELSGRMADAVERIAEYLLPAGKRHGKEWKAGSAGGEEGASLSLCIKGHKAGVWKDFASGEGGDLLDLWMAARGMSLVAAMADAKTFLGIRDDMPQRPAKTFTRPDKPRGKLAHGRAAEWLRSRGLTDVTIGAFKIVEQVRGEKVYAVFPYIDEAGEYINGKTRNIDDKKDMRQEAGAMPCLFGWHLIDPKQRVIAIAEGELDAMTLHQVGIPALSVNAGAGNHQWIENDWEKLERFNEILIFFDTDEAGEKGAREVMQRLGLDRCRRVAFDNGAKDANEYLQRGAAGPDFLAMVEAAQPMDPEELRSIADYAGEVKDSFYPPGGVSHDPRLHLDKDLDWFEFRGGEVTLWTGINGHGKSLLLSQVQLGLMAQDEQFAIFSGEMRPMRLLKRMVKQATGIDRPTLAYIDAVAAWLRGRCWVFDQTGVAKLDRVLEVFTYAARRYGVTQFVIDSLMTLDIPDDGPRANTAQKEAVAKLCAFAKRFNAHVHLVAHPRKGRDEKDAPGKMDVSGSGHLTNGVDNVFSVWRAQKDEAKPGDPSDIDAKLELSKQRNAENAPQNYTLLLWFNKACMQYRTTVRWIPLSFVSFSNQEHS